MPVKLRNLVIIFLILISLVPVFLINRWLKQLIQPRKSLLRLLLYMLIALGLIFIYTLLLVTIILNMFPPAKR